MQDGTRPFFETMRRAHMEVGMPKRQGPHTRWITACSWGALSIFLTSCSNRDSIPTLTETPDVASKVSIVDPAPDNRMPDPAAPLITLIPPGTVITEQAAEGWTHLIVKSLPEVGLGDVDQLSDKVRALSCRFFTTMMARVAPG